MAVALVTTGTASGTAAPGTVATVTKPAGVASGHYLLFAVSLYPGYGTLTPPAGCTEIGTEIVDDSGGLMNLRVFAKFAGGSEPSAYTFTVTSSSWIGVEMCAFSGVNTTTPVPSTAIGVNGFTTSVTFPGVTVANANGAVVLLFSTPSGSSPVTFPAGYTERFPASRWPVWADRLNPPTGATGALSATASADGRGPTRTLYLADASVVVAPANSSLPTLTGTAGEGNVLTGGLGTWTGSPTSWSYEFRFVVDAGEPTSGATTTAGGTTYKTIPGTNGTTSSSGFTPTYTMGPQDAGRAIFLHVSAINAGGSASADSAPKLYQTSKLPWKTLGNPFLTPLPASPPISAQLTTALRNQLDTWYANGKKWWMQGGAYGPAYSGHLIVVDSSMPRTPFTLIGRGGGAAGDITGPKAPQVKNGDAVTHLAWTMGAKTLADMGLSGASGPGIPTPPGGFQITGPVSNPAIGRYGDNHFTVFVKDTFELFELWASSQVTADSPIQWGLTAAQSIHPDYPMGSWIYGWGGYIRDVRESPGYWTDKKDVDGNNEYATWGARATSIPFFQSIMQTREMVTDGVIGHGLGVITPGSNGSWVWPAQRADVGEGGALPQGLRWQLDPTIDVDALPSLGDANSNALRKLIFDVAQEFGLLTSDSTGSDIIMQMEAMGGAWPTIPFVFNVGNVSFQDVMRSVPTSAWSAIDPSYRPAGAPAVPKLSDLRAASSWTTYGGGGTILGQEFRFPITGYGGMYSADGFTRNLIGDRTFIRLRQFAGNQGLYWYLAPSVNSNGIGFQVTATQVIAHLVDQYGGAIGSPVAVAHPVAQPYLAFREAAGTLYWETSPGGAGDPTTWTWTQVRAAAVPAWDPSALQMTFYLQGTDTTNTAVFDSLNTPPPAGAAPAVTTAPAVTPTVAQVDTVLTSSTGAWSGSPTIFSYQWRRGASNIPGATSSSYKLVADDVAQPITCSVLATNAFGSTPAQSNVVTPSAAGTDWIVGAVMF